MSEAERAERVREYRKDLAAKTADGIRHGEPEEELRAIEKSLGDAFERLMGGEWVALGECRLPEGVYNLRLRHGLGHPREEIVEEVSRKGEKWLHPKVVEVRPAVEVVAVQWLGDLDQSSSSG